MTGKIPNLDGMPGALRIVGVARQYWSPFFGRWIAQSWPRGHGADSPDRALARSWFGQAQQLIKMSAASEYAESEALTRNSPLLARDVRMKAAYGTLIEAYTTDNKYIGSVRMMYPEIQSALDTITQVPGTILYRDDIGWSANQPGTAGQVLTLQSDSITPQWADATAPSSGGPTYVAPVMNPLYAGISFATVAQLIDPYADIHLTSIAPMMTTTSAYTIVPCVYALDASYKITGITAVGTAVTTGTITKALVPMAIDCTLSAGQLYAVGWTRTDGLDTGPTDPGGVGGTTPFYSGMPIRTGVMTPGTDLRLAKRTPSVGDTFTAATGTWATQYGITASVIA